MHGWQGSELPSGWRTKYSTSNFINNLKYVMYHSLMKFSSKLKHSSRSAVQRTKYLKRNSFLSSRGLSEEGGSGIKINKI